MPVNPGERRADLHCHSIYSDGTCTPVELIDVAASLGHWGLSITDHDTTEAYELVKEYAASRGIVLIPGVELSTTFQGEAIHVLGYSFDSRDEGLKEFCRIHRQRREVRNEMMREKLVARGLTVSIEEIKALSPNAITYGRPHIALALVQRGYVPDVATAFHLYLASGKCCYVEGEKWTTQQAIEAVRSAGGVAVLAHPHLIKTKSLIEPLLTLPFDGIEAFYAHMGAIENHRWKEIAERHGMFSTGGSDFHGKIKPEGRFGSSWAPESTLDRLYYVLSKVSRSH